MKKVKLLKAEDLNELTELGYQVSIMGEERTLDNPIWINPYTLWDCVIIGKKVEARLYKYIAKNDRSNVKLTKFYT